MSYTLSPSTFCLNEYILYIPPGLPLRTLRTALYIDLYTSWTRTHAQHGELATDRSSSSSLALRVILSGWILSCLSSAFLSITIAIMTLGSQVTAITYEALSTYVLSMRRLYVITITTASS